MLGIRSLVSLSLYLYCRFERMPRMVTTQTAMREQIHRNTETRVTNEWRRDDGGDFGDDGQP